MISAIVFRVRCFGIGAILSGPSAFDGLDLFMAVIICSIVMMGIVFRL